MTDFFATCSGGILTAMVMSHLFATGHGDRIAGLHLKDVFADHLTDDGLPRRTGLNYHEVGATKRLWAEPGLGVVDLLGAVSAMPADYAGDYMVEVDVPSVESRYESHRMSYEWARRSLAVAG